MPTLNTGTQMWRRPKLTAQMFYMDLIVWEFFKTSMSLQKKKKHHKKQKLQQEKREKLRALIVFAIISTERKERKQGQDGEFEAECLWWAGEVVCSAERVTHEM